MGFFRKTESEPLAVTMAGIKIGDRVLFVGMREPQFIATLAAKTGLTGRACAIEMDEARATSASAAIERAGALIETTRGPWGLLPFDTGSFDVAVARDLLMTLAPGQRAQALREALRVLRPGGRIVVIEPAPRQGFGALLSRVSMDADYISTGGALGALKQAGYVAARIIAERDGVLYAEAAKSGGSR